MAELAHRRRSSFFFSILMIVGGFLFFAAVALDVLFHGLLVRADLPVARVIYHRVGGNDTFLFSAMSGMGDLRIILFVALAIGVALFKSRRWRALAGLGIGLGGCGLLNSVLKAAFAVPRPEKYMLFDFATYGGYSFPSGHTMAVMVTAGLLTMIYFHLHWVPRWKRWVLASLAAGLGMLEAFALLYIGVHYVTDLLAAIGVSVGWLGVMRLILPPMTSATEPKVEK